MPFFLRYTFRTIRLAAVTAGCVLAFLVVYLGARKHAPQLLRWYLQTCGAGFVKIGQLLAMRYDLLPEEYCLELGKLLDSVPPAPPNAIVATIEEDLGVCLEQCFAEFERTPLGSASIAQVHRAKLRNGEDIVLKVKRPGIDTIFRIDLANARLLGRVASWFQILPSVDVEGLMSVLTRSTREELDFRREARNAQALHELMLADGIAHAAPAIHFSLCGNQVIAMEMFRGVWLDEMIAAVHAGDSERLRNWAEQGITPERTSLLILRSMLEQFFHHGLFQADPHAANLVMLDSGKLGFVDFGMIGSVDERVQAQQLRLRQCLAAGDLHAAYEAMLDTLEPIPERDLTRFELEFKELCRDWLLAIRNPQATIAEKSTGNFLRNLFSALRKARLTLPLTVVRMQRAFIIADMSMLAVCPSVDWVPELQRFLREEGRRRALQAFQAAASIDTWQSTILAMARASALASDFVYWARARLPGLGRNFQRQSSLYEETLLLILKFARWASLTTAALVGLGALLAPRFFPNSSWDHIVNLIRPWHWWVTAGALVVTSILGRMLRGFNR